MAEPVSPTAPSEHFTFPMLSLARHWRWWMDRRLKPQGVTQGTWVVLAYLARGGNGMAQKDLAKFIGIEGPTLVGHLDRLEKQGLVERRADDKDRRSRTIHLTPAAQPLWSKISRIATKVRIELLEGVSEEDLAVCLRVFERIMANGEARL
ncbi:MAG: MarR family transcriptional regulator [Gammaproteobacteria bacterium]